MSYIVERTGDKRPDVMPAAVRLIGDWKRSLTARARFMLTVEAPNEQDVRDLASLYQALDVEEHYIRRTRGMSQPPSLPEWVENVY